MSEDLHLDPNQVQLPQEGEAGHIEVAYHDDSQQHGEVEQSTAETGETPQANTESSEPTHLGTLDHDDSTTGIVAEKVPSTYVRNKEKAEIMAHAQNDAIDTNERRWNDRSHDYKPENEEWAGEYEGRQYEIRNALATYAHEGVNTPEEALRLAEHDRDMFLKYSHAIAENHRKHGDELSLELEAIDKVYEFQQQITTLGGEKLWASQGYRVSTREDATIKTAKGYYGGLDILHIRASGEEWALSMFGGGEYKESKTEYNPDAEFQETQTIKKRAITQEDVARLGDTLTGWVDSDRKSREAEKQRQYREELEELDREGETEDPLAGDVDKWVHPDETRTDDQIAHDEKYKVEPY